ERADALFKRYDRNGDDVLTRSEWYEGVALGRRGPAPIEGGGAPIRGWGAKFATVHAWGLGVLARPGQPRGDLTDIRRKQFADYFERAHPYLSLESKQLFLSPEVAAAALATAEEVGLHAAPTLVYLCKIAAGGTQVAGIVAALDPTLDAPLGPFLPP